MSPRASRASTAPARNGRTVAPTARRADRTKQLPTKANAKATADADELRGLYRQMLLIRRFEEKTAEMYQRARIGGYCHLNLGEEATCVGLCSGMRPSDYLFTELPRARLRAGPRH